MNDNVEYMPNWKKGATAEERLMELAMIARKHPERFSQMVVIYIEELPDEFTRTRHLALNAGTHVVAGILADVMHTLFEN